MLRLASAVLIVLSFASGPVLAGGKAPGYPSGFDHVPNNKEIRDRLQELCVGVVENKARAPRRCGCYVNGLSKKLSADDFDVLRATGRFSEAAQPKARELMKTCKVNG